MASGLPATADVIGGFRDAGGTEFDRMIMSVNALNQMLAGLTATPAELSVLHSLGLAAADLAQLAGVSIIRGAIVPLTAVDTAGGVFAWQVPANCVVLRCILDVTHIATAACVLDIGYQGGATFDATIVDTLIDGQDVNVATGLFDNLANAGTNGLAMLKAAVGKWVTGSVVSGASAGIVGSVGIFYVVGL